MRSLIPALCVACLLILCVGCKSLCGDCDCGDKSACADCACACEGPCAGKCADACAGKCEGACAGACAAEDADTAACSGCAELLKGGTGWCEECSTGFNAGREVWCKGDCENSDEGLPCAACVK